MTRNKFFILFFTIILTNLSYAEVSFDTLKTKQTSYFDFFLLKFESKLLNRTLILRKQAIPSRVQYSHVSSTVEYKKKENKIFINIYAVMDKIRYTKKKYREKISDCNQIRNLIFYRKHGYKFFTQKRDTSFSEEIMNDIFRKVFFDNLTFNEKEIKFIIDKMFVNVTIFNPIKKRELTCAGKANQYILE